MAVDRSWMQKRRRPHALGMTINRRLGKLWGTSAKLSSDSINNSAISLYPIIVIHIDNHHVHFNL